MKALGNLMKEPLSLNTSLTVSESWHPLSEYATSVTSYRPGCLYLYEGSDCVEKVPSPKSHRNCTAPEERLMNVTLSSSDSWSLLLISNDADGLAHTSIVVVAVLRRPLVSVTVRMTSYFPGRS